MDSDEHQVQEAELVSVQSAEFCLLTQLSDELFGTAAFRCFPCCNPLFVFIQLTCIHLPGA